MGELVTIFAGHVTIGASVSLTMTVKLQLPILPASSSAEQMTVFVPLRNTLPLVGVQLTLTAEQLSAADASKFTNRPSHSLAGRLVTIFAGHVTTGISVSLTVTVKLHWAVLPLASVLVQFTVVVPLTKAEPLAGTQTK